MISILFIHWHVNPVIFQAGFLSLRYYSILFALGILFAYIFLQKIFLKENMGGMVFNKLALYIGVGTIAGARLGHCLFYEPDYFLRHPLEIVLPWQGIPFSDNFVFTGYQGLASHGGAIGIFIGSYLFSKKYSYKLLYILYRLCLVIPLTGAMIRLGNLMNSEIIGKASNVSWAFVFENIDFIPRHPAQLYEAILYSSLFFALRYLYGNKAANYLSGTMFGWFCIGIFSIRFFIEFFKANQETFESHLILNMGQLLSIPFIVIGVFFLCREFRHREMVRSTKNKINDLMQLPKTIK